MIYCPRCQGELAMDARFCRKCGFNQTNAHIMSVYERMTQQASATTPGHFQMPSTPMATEQGPQEYSPLASPPQTPPTGNLLKNYKASNNQQQATTIPGGQPYTPPGAPSTMQSGPQRTPLAQQPPTTPPGQPAQQLGLLSRERASAIQSNTPPAQEDVWIEPEQRYYAQQIIRTSTPRPPYAGAQPAPAQPGPMPYAPAQPYPPPQQGPYMSQAVRTSTPPMAGPMAGPIAGPQIPPQAQMGYGYSMNGALPQSVIITNASRMALDRWRQGWWQRQHSEAAPAVGVARGQAVVPEPLMRMQHSIARMRAIILPKKKAGKTMSPRGGLVTLVMIVAIGILLFYNLVAIVGSSSPDAAQLALQAAAALPTLTVQNAKNQVVSAGQTMNVHGAHFPANATITFALNTTAITNAQRQSVSVQCDDQGAFDANITLASTTQVGTYVLQATDLQSGENAQLNLEVLPSNTKANNTPLTFATARGKALKNLDLHATANTNFRSPGNTTTITITNSGDTPINWKGATVLDNDLHWLQIDNGNTEGILDPGASANVPVSVSTVGLPTSIMPFTGYIVFTVDNQQGTIPVTLTVLNSSLELLINPNPVTVQFLAGGSCQPASLTIVNLSNQLVFWNANLFGNSVAFIKLNGQPMAQGTLQPAYQGGNSASVQITCNNIGQGNNNVYQISISYNLHNGGGQQIVAVKVQ